MNLCVCGNLSEGNCSELKSLLLRLLSKKGLTNPVNDSTLGVNQIVEHLTRSAAGGRALHIEPLHVSEEHHVQKHNCALKEV